MLTNSFISKASLSVLASLSLISCSGGGGGSSTPPPATPPANRAPVVSAGDDKTVFETRSVSLEGTVDDDGNPTISWVQTLGPTVTLEGANTLTPTFATPNITIDETLIFEVTANDGVNTPVTDTVTIEVRNVDPIGIVSPPNPHSFPLLVAMELEPTLPFTLHPVASGSQVGPIFDAGDGDVVFVFSYIGGRFRAGGSIPDLELIYPFTWRGFFEIADESVTSFTDLIGETVVISGPVGTSENGGGDIIFRAAARRQGVDPDTDLNVMYVAGVENGTAVVMSGQAAAIAVPAPASSGIVLASRASGGTLAPAIDFQEVFNGVDAVPNFPSVPTNQMPLGGAHASRASLDTPGKRAAMELLIEVYAEAAELMMTEPMTYSPIATAAFTREYEATGAPIPPAPTLTAAIVNGGLVYRSDITLDVVEADLADWIEELLGARPDPAFFNTTFDQPVF